MQWSVENFDRSDISGGPDEDQLGNSWWILNQQFDYCGIMESYLTDAITSDENIF